MEDDDVGLYLPDHERRETSQFGENGLLEALFEEIGPRQKLCVDVGAQYLRRRSNVFPLWAREGWDALLVEADEYLCSRMEADLRALPPSDRGSVEIVHARVEARGPRSLDRLFSEYDVPSEPDLLNIDVDGIDYHLWKHLEEHRPRVVVVEYNSSIPPDRRIVGKELYNSVGASLGAMVDLARKKNYGMVALTPSNALFVTEEHLDSFEAVNDVERMWEPEYHGQFLTHAMRTFEEELFFSAPPVVRDDYDFATPESANVIQEDEVYFARGRPSPGAIWRYFVRYPVRYFLNRSRWFERLKHWLERRGLSWVARPFVALFQTYD